MKDYQLMYNNAKSKISNLNNKIEKLQNKINLFEESSKPFQIYYVKSNFKKQYKLADLKDARIVAALMYEHAVKQNLNTPTNSNKSWLELCESLLIRKIYTPKQIEILENFINNHYEYVKDHAKLV